MAAHRENSLPLLLSLLAGFVAGAIAHGWRVEPWTWCWIDSLDLDPDRQGVWLGAIVATVAGAIGSASSPRRSLGRVLGAVAAAAAYTAAVAASPELLARETALGSSAVLAGTAIGFFGLGAALRPGIAAYPAALGTVLALDRLAPAVPVHWIVVGASGLAAVLAARRDVRTGRAFNAPGLASALVTAGVVAAAVVTARIEAVLAFAIACAVLAVVDAGGRTVLVWMGAGVAVIAFAAWALHVAPTAPPIWSGLIAGALAGFAIVRPADRGPAIGVGLGAAAGLAAVFAPAGWGCVVGAIAAIGAGTAIGASALPHGAVRRTGASVPALGIAAAGIVWIWPVAMDPARPSPVHGLGAPSVVAVQFDADTQRALVDLSLALHPEPRSMLVIGAQDAIAARRAVQAGLDAVDVIFADRAEASAAGDALAPAANRHGTRLTIASGPTAAELVARADRFDVVIDLRPVDPNHRAIAAMAESGRYFRWTPQSANAGPDWIRSTRSLLDCAPRSTRAWRATVRGDRAIGLAIARGDARPEPDAFRPTGTIGDTVDLLVRRLGDAPFVERLIDAAPVELADRIAAAENPVPPYTGPANRRDMPLAFAGPIRRLDDDDLNAAAALAEESLEALMRWNFGRRFVDATASRLLDAGERTRAAALYDRGVEAWPSWGAGFLGQARRLIAALSPTDLPERWEKANALLERSITHDPEAPLAWRLQGVCLLRARSDAAAARSCFENAASLDPDDPITKSYLWRYAERDGRYDEAIALLIAAQRGLPHDRRVRDALYKIAPRLLVAKRADLARRAVDAVASHYQNDPGFFLVLSQVHDARGNLDAAINAARRSASMTDPPVRGYFLHLYRLLARSTRDRERDELRTFMQQTFRVDPAALPE